MTPKSLLQKVDPRQAALIILDMQRGSWPPKEREGGGEQILPQLIALITAGRVVKLPIIFVRNSHSPWTDLPSRREQMERIGSDYLSRYREGTPGIDFKEGLSPEPGELIYIKHSYSPFAHGPLDLILRSRRIKTLLLTGGSVLGAVETAAKDAFVRGYRVVVVKDCVTPRTGPVYDVVSQYIESKLGLVVSSEELRACWQGPKLVRGERKGG